MCGEHVSGLESCGRNPGSSPHVRGARSPEPSTWTRQGIIPACAGSTQWSHCIHGLLGDHPRMCGEHSGGSAVGNSIGGSSPHVRGAQRQFRYHKLPSGIIPACAGSTHCPPTHLVSARDHPRMCGEHSSGIGMIRYGTGSSPHVRGARADTIVRTCLRGIIPACAGSTPTPSAGRTSRRDHPRMCGEHALVKLKDTGDRGSSPHVRGAPCRR